VLVLGVGYGFQSARWQRIADAPRLHLRSFYGMLLGGLACNNVLPVRIGELLRARWLSRDAPMPGGRAFGSVVLDRICDVVTLTTFFLVSIQAVASPAWLVRLAIGAVLALLLIAGVLALARVYAARRSAHVRRKARGPLVQILRDTVRMLGEPIGRRRAATWIGLSVCTWTLASLAAGLVARSVGIGLHRHIPVARRRCTRAPRRACRAGPRILDPLAGELVCPHDAGRWGVHRCPGITQRPIHGRCDLGQNADALGPIP
jgi:hypothetical protein